jgi:hypothetical protein
MDIPAVHLSLVVMTSSITTRIVFESTAIKSSIEEAQTTSLTRDIYHGMRSSWRFRVARRISPLLAYRRRDRSALHPLEFILVLFFVILLASPTPNNSSHLPQRSATPSSHGLRVLHSSFGGSMEMVRRWRSWFVV